MFNTFVFMQIFNEINSRKLGEKEYNMFRGFFNNFMFLGIILATVVIQVTLVQYGGVPIRTSPLTWNQHALCISIGLFSFVQSKSLTTVLLATHFRNTYWLICRPHCESSAPRLLVHLVQL
jgi:magnesium-transporting ATPase (P-type)